MSETRSNRMKTFLILAAAASLVVLALLFYPSLAGTSTQRVPAVSQRDLSRGVVPVAQNQALVVYFSGTVDVSSGKAWEPVRIGTYLNRGERIRAGTSSSCELQFGDRAVVVLEERSELLIDELLLKEGQSDIALRVPAGSLLCKVSRLAGGDECKVKTKSAVCGVRGTEFRVTVSGGDETNIAVQEGKVYILPGAMDAVLLRDQPGEEGQKIAFVQESLINSAPLVSAGQEITVRPQTASAAEKVVREWEVFLEKALATPTWSEEDAARIRRETEEAASVVGREISEPVNLTPENKKALEHLERATFIPVSVRETDAPPPEEETVAPAAPQLLTIEITTSPADAAIILDGQTVGRGGYAGIFVEGARAEFLIRKNGFADEILNLEAKSENLTTYKVELKPETGGQTKLEEGDGDSPPPVKADNKEEIAKTAKTDQPVHLQKKKTVRSETRKDRPVEKKNPLVGAVKISENAILGQLAAADGRLYAADKAGVVYALDAAGALLWKIETENNPNTNSSPVLTDGRVYFSGLRELVIADARAGDIVGRVSLEGPSNHMFGRHILKAGAHGVLPTDKSLRLFDLASGATIKECPLPSAVRMTPTFFKGKLYLVDATGALQAVDAKTGKVDPRPLATKAVEPIAIEIAVAGGRGYVAGRKNLLICIDLAAKKVVWERTLESSAYTYHDLVLSDSGLYVLAGDILFGFSFRGRPLGKPRLGVSAPPVFFGGSLYLGTEDGKFLKLDPRSLSVKASFEAGKVIRARPIPLGPLLAAGTEDGTILLIDPRAF